MSIEYQNQYNSLQIHTLFPIYPTPPSPLFAGIYQKGAGLGPAITFLFVTPAVNILAITYTGTVIGMDFAIAQMFLCLGMHRGPLLAYLISDPELSLPSILITASIIGRLKAWVYVFWVSIFSTLAGLICGDWVDGASPAMVVIYLIGFLTLLSGGLYFVNRRNPEFSVGSG
jgi:uncharacterized membrane protein YraQ (UPF0718 family)